MVNLERWKNKRTTLSIGDRTYVGVVWKKDPGTMLVYEEIPELESQASTRGQTRYIFHTDDGKNIILNQTGPFNPIIGEDGGLVLKTHQDS